MNIFESKKMPIAKKTFRISYLLIISVFLTLGLSISFQSLLAQWVPPTQTPPQGNVSPPINEGIDAQTKNGELIVDNNFTANNVYSALDFSADGATLYVDSNSSRVGIGTINPWGRLHVVDIDSSADAFIVQDNGDVSIPNVFYAQQGGKIGIGPGFSTNAPDAMLHVLGGVCIDDDNACTDPAAGNLFVQGNATVIGNLYTDNVLNENAGAQSIGLGDADDDVYVNGELCLGGVCQGSWSEVISTGGGGSLWATSSDNTKLFPKDLNLRIGVGTNAPNGKLSVNNGGTLAFDVQTNGDVSVPNVLYVNQDAVAANRRVGIGTDIPAERLEVADDTAGTARLRVTDTGQNPEIQLQYGAGVNEHWGLLDAHSNDSFNIWGNGSNRLTILQDGSVGIGDNITPTARLDVNGSVRLRTLATCTLKTDASGNISCGSDISDDSVSFAELSGLCTNDGEILKRSGGAWACGTDNAGTGGDNLGNHIATQNIQLGSHWLSGDGDNEGISVQSNGDVSIPNTFYAQASTHNVGIGTINPVSTIGYSGPILQISGAQAALKLTNSGGTAATWEMGTNWFGAGNTPTLTIGEGSSYIMSLQKGGNVGIGTISPGTKLEVAGGDTYLQAMSIGQSGGHYQEIGYNVGFTDTSDAYTYRINDTAASIRLGESGGDITFRTAPAGTAANPLTLTERMRIDVGGNVGIGTNNPGAKLQVNGTIRQNNICAAGQSLNTNASGDIICATDATGGGSFWTQSATTLSPANASIDVSVPNTFYIDTSAQRVGIGSGMTAPSNALHVAGNIGATGWIGAGCEGACEGSGGYVLNYSDGHTYGTGYAQYASYGRFDGGVQVDGNTVIDANGQYFYGRTGGVADTFGQVNTSGFGVNATSDGDWDLLVYENSSYMGNLYLGYNDTAYIRSYDTNENIAILPNGTGNVGIGIANPGAYKLNVNGSLYATSYAGGSCDVAERYEAVPEDIETLEPGDIVSISKDNELKIEKVSTPFSSMAIGVYSTAPQMVMGNTDEARDRNDPPVALIGRVPVKISTENGPVEIGDLIVSSSKPGYGMACRLKELDLSLPEDERWQILADNEKCRNAAIGKALENLESGEGQIEVFLTKSN